MVWWGDHYMLTRLGRELSQTEGAHYEGGLALGTRFCMAAPHRICSMATQHGGHVMATHPKATGPFSKFLEKLFLIFHQMSVPYVSGTQREAFRKRIHQFGERVAPPAPVSPTADPHNPKTRGASPRGPRSGAASTPLDFSWSTSGC